jgi:hypothetical protein
VGNDLWESGYCCNGGEGNPSGVLVHCFFFFFCFFLVQTQAVVHCSVFSDTRGLLNLHGFFCFLWWVLAFVPCAQKKFMSDRERERELLL